VRGITLSEEMADDRVVGMVCLDKDSQDELLVVSENGYGKRSPLEEYRITNRGGKGVRAMKLTEKTGQLVTIKTVNDTDDLMIINKSGITIRLRMSELRSIGRATQGVRLLKISQGDEISSVAKVAAEEKEIDLETDGSELLTPNGSPDGEGPGSAPDPDLTDLTDPESISAN
jgi:DNA gyrase subunit A